MNSIDSVKYFLNKDRIKNSNIINFMINNTILYYKKKYNTILLIGKTDCRWVYISSSNETEYSEILDSLDTGEKYFAAVEDWMLPLIERNRTIKWQLSTMKYYLPDNVTINCSLKNNPQPLKQKETQYIFDNSKYQNYINRDYISNLIETGYSSGIYKDDKLVAWAMTHDDGAIGFIHVIEEYRRQGLAKEVVKHIILQLRRKKILSFMHIEEDNIKSTNMALKLGFIKDRIITWLETE